MRLQGALAQGAAAVPVPATGQKPIGFAAVGIGGISTAFMEAVSSSPNIKLAGLVTGHPDTKGVQFSQMYNIPKSSVYTYETFDQIKDNPDIDALYIGLPNSMHCEYTVRGAAAGKHVLCEKPMAISSAECRTMIDACKKADREADDRLPDAVRPDVAGGVRHCAVGRAGQDTVAARKHVAVAGDGLAADEAVRRRRPDDGRWDLSAERHPLPGAGGAGGVYRGAGDARQGRPAIQAEVEQSIEWTMKFPSGIITSCGCSYGQFGPQTLMVQRRCKGFMALTPAFGGGGIHLSGSAGTSHYDVTGTGKGHFQLALEGEHMAACIRNNKQPKSPGEEGLKDLVAIERFI
jgi:predicted dehydrogenase